MRLDYRCGPWWVYHADRCEVLHRVLWVDDDTNQYAIALLPEFRPGMVEIPMSVHQARKIEIHWGRKLVIINPIEDADDESIVRAVSMPEVQ